MELSQKQTGFIRKKCNMIPKNPDWEGNRVFLDVSIGGRIVIELYDSINPRTCEHFRKLCTGETTVDGKPFGYKGTKFHRVISGAFIQGGDCGDTPYECESFVIKHSTAGLVSMVNGTQFFITLRPLPQLDDKYTVIGRVIEGISVVSAVSNLPAEDEEPTVDAVIIECGQL